MAAIPDGAQPNGKPAIKRASPAINDPVTGKRIRGKAPEAHPMVSPGPDLQASLPTAKPVLYHASPMINDPLIGKHIDSPSPQK